MRYKPNHMANAIEKWICRSHETSLTEEKKNSRRGITAPFTESSKATAIKNPPNQVEKTVRRNSERRIRQSSHSDAGTRREQRVISMIIYSMTRFREYTGTAVFIRPSVKLFLHFFFFC